MIKLKNLTGGFLYARPHTRMGRINNSSSIFYHDIRHFKKEDWRTIPLWEPAFLSLGVRRKRPIALFAILPESVALVDRRVQPAYFFERFFKIRLSIFLFEMIY
jgi:hypothetical protein